MGNADGINFATGLLADVLTWAGWIMLVGVPASWLADVLGWFGPVRRMSVYAPLSTAFIGVVILEQLRRWPF